MRNFLLKQLLTLMGVILLKIDIPQLDITVEVDEQGMIELPQQGYTPAQLKTIARVVSRHFRQSYAEKEIKDMI